MSGNTVPRITEAEHIGPNDTGDNISAKRSASYLWDGSNWQRISGDTSGINVRTIVNPLPAGSNSIGAVTANAGTNLNTSALALASTQTDKSQFTKLTDGTNTVLVTAGGEIRTAQSYNTRSDIYTTTGDGTVIDTSLRPLKHFAVQVKSTGGPATVWDVRLEGSLNGTNFSQILQHTNGTGDGATIWATTPTPSLYFRSKCTALTLSGATNINVIILGNE